MRLIKRQSSSRYHFAFLCDLRSGPPSRGPGAGFYAGAAREMKLGFTSCLSGYGLHYGRERGEGMKKEDP